MSTHNIIARKSIDVMTRKDLCQYVNTSSQVYSVPVTEVWHIQILRREKHDSGTASWQPKVKAAYVLWPNPSEEKVLHGGKPGWIPKLWPCMNFPSQGGNSKCHHLPLAGGSRTWARVPESKKEGATGHPEVRTLWAADCSLMTFPQSTLQLQHHKEGLGSCKDGAGHTHVGRGINNILHRRSLGSL